MPCAAAIAASALAAGCSSSSSGPASTSPSSTSSPSSGGSASPAATSTSTSTSTTSAGLAAAERMVAAFEAPTTAYPVPAASVPGVSGLKGRTVYYIPILESTPSFVVAAAAMRSALAAAGLKLQVCDGEALPSAIASCVEQATTAGAAGMILDSIPEGMADNAITAAIAKGIPVVIADQVPPSGTKNTDQLAYVPGVGNQPTQIAWWMIADSGGKANAIIAEEADSPSSISYVTDSLPVYKQYCPDCTVTVQQITAADSSSVVASGTSSELLSHPDADYFYTEFENSLQPTIEGIQQSSRTGISVAEAAGTTYGLGLLKSGDLVKAVVVVDEAYAGWALTDEILRMATKSAPVGEAFPSRLFTSQNIGSIQVTTAAQASGAWFGGDSYQGAFEKLWGVG